MKLQRWEQSEFGAYECSDGDWVKWDDVQELKQSLTELLDVAHQVVENYYDGLGDEQSVARAARKAITKFEGSK